MIVYSRDLPTRGLTAKADSCELFPMTFSELLKYLADEQLTPLREYIRNLEYMVKKDPKVGDFCLLDADNLMFMFQVVTINKELKFPISVRCPYCGKVHSITVASNEVDFRDLDEKALQIFKIKLDGKYIPIRYITINEFINKVGKLPRYIEDEKVNLIKLICMIDLPPAAAASLVLNAIQEDIATLNYLDTIWFDLINPVQVPCDKIDPVTNKQMSVTAAVTMSAVDVFRKIFESNPITEDKVLTIQTSETRGAR